MNKTRVQKAFYQCERILNRFEQIPNESKQYKDTTTYKLKRSLINVCQVYLGVQRSRRRRLNKWRGRQKRKNIHDFIKKLKKLKECEKMERKEVDENDGWKNDDEEGINKFCSLIWPANL